MLLNAGLAVRRLFAYARSTPNPILGLAPEGMDLPGGILGWPPPGGGRVMLQLARNGYSSSRWAPMKQTALYA